jgi:hypothetical protein
LVLALGLGLGLGLVLVLCLALVLRLALVLVWHEQLVGNEFEARRDQQLAFDHVVLYRNRDGGVGEID